MATTAGGFQHILCPIDFSKHSRAALRVAAELASRGRGRVTALYVSDPLLDAAAAAAAYDTRAMKAQSLKELRQFVGKSDAADVPIDCMMAPGEPAATITSVAERRDATLVVMGSHGLTGPHKWLLGSTTEHVLRRSSVPVLIVPRKVPKGKKLGSWPGQRALVAVDLIDYRPADVKALQATLKLFKARPIFLHVMQPVAFPSWFRAKAAHERSDTDAHSALRALAAKVGVKADCQLLFGDPADEIAAASASARAGLVILKLRRAPRLTGPRRGSVTYRVAAVGAAPVLALP
jgi:nucleotide-binding universal stress UspA family protein